ncbi:hypothetical protein [Methanobacterium formicicum]|jgi:hypothetical protein|uniref:hypothetical protein n=1 Tax=Methanobacterium formicicum TaxID=2162 RepID=UPI00178C4BEF|nr:hypothetical protein [Methanobacterium formicicum]
MAKFYNIRDFLDDESVEKFINELIEENMEYLRTKYRQLVQTANKSRNRVL